jgi:hypothetical protein
MPWHGTTRPFFSSSLRLCAFPLACLPLFPSAPLRLRVVPLLLFLSAPLRLWCARKSLVDLAT